MLYRIREKNKVGRWNLFSHVPFNNKEANKVLECLVEDCGKSKENIKIEEYDEEEYHEDLVHELWNKIEKNDTVLYEMLSKLSIKELESYLDDSP
jgi:hypothetical protein